MGTPTYTPLANITLGSSAASVTFSSISQAYRDLVLIAQGTTSTSAGLRLQFNSDTGTNYSWVYAGGDGSSTNSGSNTTNYVLTANNAYWDGTTIANTIVNIMDYTATDKHKTTLSRSNHSTTGTDMIASRWANTAAITSILVFPAGGTWAAGSTFALYGIAA